VTDNAIAWQGERGPQMAAPSLDLSRFALRDMVAASEALRELGRGAASMEEAAQRLAQYLHANLGDGQGKQATALVRLFKTHPYRGLPPGLQVLVRSRVATPQGSVPPDLRSLVLLGTAGSQPEWNDRAASKGHQAIPLPSEEALLAAPMIARVVQQLGVAPGDVVRPPDPALLLESEERSFNVIHVPQAAGSPFIPDQDFVRREGVRSVVGFGGMLPDGSIFVFIVFARVPVSREVAQVFGTLGLSAKMALLPFTNGPVFSGEAWAPSDAGPRLAIAEAAALRQLLRSHEHAVLATARRLEEHAHALAAAKAATDEAVATKMRFLNVLAHELSNPITPLALQVQLLSSYPEVASKHGANLEVLKRNVQRLSGLTSDLLDFARLQNGALHLRRAPVDLDAVVHDAVASFRPEAERKGVRLEADLAAGGAPLEADPQRVGQVLFNLLSNAVKFTPRGGSVEVRTASADGEARVEVVDSGRGLAPEDVQTLFQPFQRGSSARDEAGTGLGLYISKAIVEAHGGRIAAESPGPGKGSAFRVALPRRAEAAR
jgi:two-component system, NtrC family, sensor kinase